MLDTLLEQLNSPLAIGVAIVAVIVFLMILRKLITIIFLVVALGFGYYALARQNGWDIPYVLPGSLEAMADAAVTAAGEAAASLDSDAVVRPEALGVESRALGGASPQAVAAEELAEGLRTAEVVYNAPESMQLNMPVDLRLAIDVSGSEELETLFEGLEGELRGGQAELTEQATASLSGSGFDIRPLRPERQILSGDRPNTWQWEVTPRQAGLRTLTLEVFAHPGGGDAAASVEAYRDEIEVNVTLLSRALGFAQTTQPVVGWVAGALSIAIAGFSFMRRRRKHTMF